MSCPTRGSMVAATLMGRGAGETVQFPVPLRLSEFEFTHARVDHAYGTATGALLIRLLPRGFPFICKFEDLRREHSIMSAVCHMNHRWRDRGVNFAGIPLEAVTYAIVPLGPEAGLVSVVPESQTLCELSRGRGLSERHLRVAEALEFCPRRLDRLAMTTAAFLTMGYALGIRDSHDDNIMLRADGSIFRIDLGFAFGRTPELDAPITFVPQAVRFALGDDRWAEVVATCRRALRALSGHGPNNQPAWDCLRQVPELLPSIAEVHVYTRTLSHEDFDRKVQRADQWSFSRSAKNTVREAVRYAFRESEVTTERLWLGFLDPLGVFQTALGPQRPQQPQSQPRPQPRPPYLIYS